MPERTSYPPGTPCWADLGTPDLQASTAFYGELLGWRAHTEPDPSAGGYTTVSLDGDPDRPVAGMMPAQTTAQPVVWIAYITVTDADAVAKTVQGTGGQVVMGPMEIGDQGRIALFADPMGAALGLWEPAGFPGAAVVNEPGAYTWCELACRDTETAKAFYGEVLGWRARTGADGDYTEWWSAGERIGGMVEMGEDWPGDIPPHWAVYFAVADCDAAASRTAELGGSVAAPPLDVEAGRIAALMDPQGGRFSIIALNA